MITQRPRVTGTGLAKRRPGGDRRRNPTRGPQSWALLLRLPSSWTRSRGIISLSRATNQAQSAAPSACLEPAEVRNRKSRHWSAPTRCFFRGLAEREGVAMASSGVGVNPGGSANEAPEIPDNVGDWLRGVYRFATDRNDFRRNLILNLGLFAAGVWLARNLSDIDLMAPQPGV